MSDAESLDRLLPALYECISGPAGVPRDWKRMRSFYYPGAVLLRTMVAEDNSPNASFMSVDDFVESAERYFNSYSFFEIEIARTSETFGNIAHVMSTYESRKTANGEPFARGINSIQLYHDGSRYWIVSMTWDIEREGNPIPARYLP